MLEVFSITFLWVLDLIFGFVYVADACALASILPKLSFIYMTYFSPEKKAAPASTSIFLRGFVFCTPLWTVSKITTRDSHVFSLVRTVFSTFDVHCACGYAHPLSYPFRIFLVYWLTWGLSFGRTGWVWVSKREDRTLQVSSVTFLSVLVWYFPLRLSQTHAHLPAFCLHYPGEM
jgi:hypothetical protein